MTDEEINDLLIRCGFAEIAADNIPAIPRSLFANLVKEAFMLGANTGMPWQPIESAPKDGRVILVSNKDRVRAVQYDYGWIYPVSWATLGFSPTHWMPLPEPPK